MFEGDLVRVDGERKYFLEYPPDNPPQEADLGPLAVKKSKSAPSCAWLTVRSYSPRYPLFVARSDRTEGSGGVSWLPSSSSFLLCSLLSISPSSTSSLKILCSTSHVI